VKDIHAQRILVLDFGSQYTQLIARRLREIGIYSEIYPYDIEPQRIEAFAPGGIILSGGPESTLADDAPEIADVVFAANVPVLGICYGMQAMARHFGGSVVNTGQSEFGHADVREADSCQLLQSLLDASPRRVTTKAPSTAATTATVWMSHGDRVESLPAGFRCTAHSDNAPIAAMVDDARKLYGVQFHPEVTHTPAGKQMLETFVKSVCALATDWTADNIVEDAVARIRQQVGSDTVLLALSGGVDSSVVALLLHKAVGQQLRCVFVDNGLLRHQEGDQVMKTFADNLGVNVKRVDAEQRFLTKLEGLDDPEDKRKAIGKEFIAVFEEEAALIQDARWLAQGTIYPDVIESAGAASGKAHVIKSHHNVGGLPENMALQLVEPLRELFKDEVRAIGVQLGLAESMVQRHPFPGPGLGVRILGEVNSRYADILRRADAIFIAELYAHELYQKVSQAFVVFLPVKSVGVTGDGRRYGYVVSLRAVETIDFMTARASHLPDEFLDLVAGRILNEVPEIARVVYDISSKPPGTIEWE